MKYVLNYGGGVNSTALLCYMEMKGDPMFKDLTVVFSDTGGEMPETYAYVDRFEAWLISKGQKLVRVKKADKTLEQYCLDGNTVPQRMWRWCTDKWKARPIKEWCDENIGKPRTHLLAIAADEAHRATHMGTEEVPYAYPLVNAGITRAGCEEVIRHAGLDVPPKSGCFYCPLAPNRFFVDLKKEHPDLFQRVVDMEKKSIAFYSKDGKVAGTLKHKPIEDIVGLQDKQADLFDLFDSGCQSGQCFV